MPKRLNGKETVQNGAVLNGDTSHPYIHVIENKDEEIFKRITQYIVLEKQTGKIDIEYLRKINDLLRCFEREHYSTRNKKGNLIIKPEYVKRLIR